MGRPSARLRARSNSSASRSFRHTGFRWQSDFRLAREQQERSGQLVHVAGRPPDALSRPPGGRRQRLISPQHVAGKLQHRQRAAQLVARVARELALARDEVGQPLRVPDERIGEFAHFIVRVARQAIRVELLRLRRRRIELTDLPRERDDGRERAFRGAEREPGGQVEPHQYGREGQEAEQGREACDAAAIEDEKEALRSLVGDVHHHVDVTGALVVKPGRQGREICRRAVDVAAEIDRIRERERRIACAPRPKVRGFVAQRLADQHAFEQRAGEEHADDRGRADEGRLQQESAPEPSSQAGLRGHRRRPGSRWKPACATAADRMACRSPCEGCRDGCAACRCRAAGRPRPLARAAAG
jgi:hypothetical protein